MARNVSSYSNTPRAERSSAFFDSAPTPTAKARRTPASSRPGTPVEEVIPEFERTSHRYATSGGERTYFSSAGLARAYSMRDSSSSSKGRSRTNPPSPHSPARERHRSASPGIRHRQKADSSSESSSSGDELDSEAEQPKFVPRAGPRQKAVPKSRLQPGQTFRFQGPGSGEESSSTNHHAGHHHPAPSRRRRHSLHDRSRPYNYPVSPDLSADSEYYQGNESDNPIFAPRAHEGAGAEEHASRGSQLQPDEAAEIISK